MFHKRKPLCAPYYYIRFGSYQTTANWYILLNGRAISSYMFAFKWIDDENVFFFLATTSEMNAFLALHLFLRHFSVNGEHFGYLETGFQFISIIFCFVILVYEFVAAVCAFQKWQWKRKQSSFCLSKLPF